MITGKVIQLYNKDKAIKLAKHKISDLDACIKATTFMNIADYLMDKVGLTPPVDSNVEYLFKYLPNYCKRFAPKASVNKKANWSKLLKVASKASIEDSFKINSDGTFTKETPKAIQATISGTNELTKPDLSKIDPVLFDKSPLAVFNKVIHSSNPTKTELELDKQKHILDRYRLQQKKNRTK